MNIEQLAAKAEVHIKAERFEEAAKIYETLINEKPDDAGLLHVLGLVYSEQKRWDAACDRIQQAIRIDPHHAGFYRSLGDVHQSSGNLTAAINAYQKAHDLTPKDLDILLNMGNAIYRTGKLDQAMDCYQRILAIDPDHVKALNNIGKTHYDQGDPKAALKWYEKSLHFAPDYAEAQFNRAIVLLLTGNYEQGWPAYESRFLRQGAEHVYPHTLTSNRWDGSPYNGERLLVHCEQGLGDIIHFSRYISMVKALGGELIMEVPSLLVPLIHNMESVDQVIAFSPQTPPSTPHDLYIPLMSLPLLLRTTLASIPDKVPYIHPDPQKSADWKSRINTQGLRVGIVWAGSDIDPSRICKFEDFSAWWNVPGVHFYSLQKGNALRQIESLNKKQPIIHLGDKLNDFSDTAAVIANLDLVISIDTATAHLAGAMGKPVWVLLPLVADWRWLLKRSDSPWYPTARLFRQQKSNDWTHPIRNIAEALKQQTLQQEDNNSVVELKNAATPVTNKHALQYYAQGRELEADGDHKQAAIAYQQAIACHPQWAEAHFNLGSIYHEQGLISQAIDAYTTACRINPTMQQALSNLGLAHHQNGDLKQAAAYYEQAVALHHDLAIVLNNLGVVREQQGDTTAAVECYQCALKVDALNADALYNLGNIHLAGKELTQAKTCYLKTLEINPKHFKAHGNLGRVYHLLGRMDLATASLNEALELNPDYAEAHLNRAVIRLLLGDWAGGWPEYEWRFQCHDWQRTYPHRLYGQRWDGSTFKGKTLLVHSEQGIGDALQFVRYLPLVKEKGGRVILEARKSLIKLFECLDGVDELIELSKTHPPAPHYDIYTPLCSLPNIFNTRPGTVPNEKPYLQATEAKIDQWRARLPNEGLNIGLVWSGNDTYQERSCQLTDLAPLAFVKCINWIGLQKGPAADQADPDLLPYNFQVNNLGATLDDFTDTAAVVACLDLIISIDTAVAHLAGAMGKPVWVLLPVVPDWRWMLERSRTPWYPSMHLFRQSNFGDWVYTAAHLSAALERWRKTTASV